MYFTRMNTITDSNHLRGEQKLIVNRTPNGNSFYVNEGRFKRSLSRWMPRVLLIVAALQFTGVAEADNTSNSQAGYQPLSESNTIGMRTEQLLDMQRTNRVAAPQRSMPGPVASAVWQRYLKSFDHPVPDLYRDADATMSR